LVVLGLWCESWQFVMWAKKVCTSLQQKGHWADLTDPCSGYPIFGERGPGWYPDVIGGQMLLQYSMIDTGCCKLIAHPKWQTKVSLACTVPLLHDLVQQPTAKPNDRTAAFEAGAWLVRGWCVAGTWLMRGYWCVAGVWLVVCGEYMWLVRSECVAGT
jgi:hypothetical protein